MNAGARTFFLVALALVAFAANSILTRAALAQTQIDPVLFTAIRIASGALMLWLIVTLTRPANPGRGSWVSALALFGYAILFSLAYRSLSAATGALILFGAVQVTMTGRALAQGEALAPSQWLGFSLALGGLVWLLLPGLAAPPLPAALMMIGAGVAWGIYTLRARGAGDPTRVTAANFALACVPALLLALVMASSLNFDGCGVALAIGSGAIASGIGYAVWYAALRHIRTHTAAVAQLSVPVITALAGVLLLAEPLTSRLIVAGVVILGGIALVALHRPSRY